VPGSKREKKRRVGFPGHTTVKAALERHPAMLRQNQTARCVRCPNGTAKNLQTQCRCNGIDAPPPDKRRQATPPLPEMPLTRTGNRSEAQCAQIVNLLARYAYSHPALPCAEVSTGYSSAQASQHDTDFDPDILTDEGTSTG